MPGGFSPPPDPAREGAEDDRSAGSTAGVLGRGVLVPALVAMAIGVVFTAVYLAAFHDPVPHDLPVAVVGTQEQVQATAAALDPASFELGTFPDEASARDAVRHRDVYGVLLLDGPVPELLTAGANGQAVTQTLTGAFTPVAEQDGQQLTVTDLQPLAPGDTRGLAVFYAAFGVVLAGFLFGITSYQAAPQLVLRARLASAVLFAAGSGLLVALVADVAFGAVPAGFWTVASLVALLALATATTAGFVLRLVGSAGTFLTSVGLLILGNATSTGNLPAEYLPG